MEHTSPGLKYEYHDAVVERHQIGPKRELILDVVLDQFLNPGAPKNVQLRFGAIDNMEAVRSFFQRPSRVTQPGGFERLERIELITKGKWLIVVDHRGQVTIATHKTPQEM